MEIPKLPLERFIFFIAGTIPGATALLIFNQAHPGSLQWLMGLTFLGYKTKIAVGISAAFVVGNSMTAFLSAILGGLGGAVGGLMGASTHFKPYYTWPTAPWRDPRWRLVLSNVLGSKSPKDSNLMSQSLFDLRDQAIQSLPVPSQMAEKARLASEKIQTEIDDGTWAQWYEHYHYIVLQPNEKDYFQHIRQSLNSCFQSASVYVLISAFIVPQVRHWWLILPSCLWLSILAAEIYSGITQYNNKWSTLSGQIRYLSDLSRTKGTE